MLGEAGSIASLVGLPLSILALAFAIYQLTRLRGETRAAREAAEEAQRLLRRDLTNTDLARLSERIQGLIELHRAGNRARALDRYPEIRELFIDIRRRHPQLSEEHRSQIFGAVETLADMQRQIEALLGQVIPPEIWTEFNAELLKLQSVLPPELEDQLK